MQRSPGNVTADAMPTAQINGVVWTQVIVGNTVYVGGSFTQARPAGVPVGGAGSVARSNLMAYNLTTGAIVSTFAPNANGQVRALAVSPDGTRLYAGGDFTTVNGASHQRIAAFDAVTGALLPGFTARTDGVVRGLTASNTTVYAGGSFGSANGVSRSRVAAFNGSTGALLPFVATADSIVYAVQLTPDNSKVVVGGAFRYLNGAEVRGLAAVNATTGANVSWIANQTVYSYGTGAAFLSLSTDGTAIYGTAYNYYGSGNLEGAFSADPATGKINWVEDCHGDSYGTFGVNQIVYVVSHAHYCANDGGWPEQNPRTFRRAMAFTHDATGTLLKDTVGYPNHAGQPAPSIINWFPDLPAGTYTGQSQAAWSVTGNSSYVVAGGEFPSVNGVAQQGLVRFAVPGAAPRKQAPTPSGAGFVPSLSTPSSSSVKVTWQTGSDRDDQALTYRVVRDGNTAAPVYTVTANSWWWNRPTLTFTDTGLAPGSTHSYRLYMSDGDGNAVSGNAVSITTPGGSTSPSAVWSNSCSGLACSFDGSGSTAPNATISSYAWTFGDGGTASGARVSHTYGAAGTYSVTLRITDSLGRSASSTRSITVTSGGATTASDTFGRSVSGGWGAADTGGAWTVPAAPSNFAVNGSVGTMTLPSAGAGYAAYLNSVSAANLSVSVDVGLNKAATGGGVYHAVAARHTGTTDYRTKIKLDPSGAVTLYLGKVVNGTETTLSSGVVSGLTAAGTDRLRIKLTLSGANPTTLSAKVWKVGTAEPAAAQRTVTDSTAGLQGAGGIGVWSYLSATATNAPVIASYDNLSAS
jgi:hypothetical protein